VRAEGRKWNEAGKGTGRGTAAAIRRRYPHPSTPHPSTLTPPVAYPEADAVSLARYFPIPLSRSSARTRSSGSASTVPPRDVTVVAIVSEL